MAAASVPSIGTVASKWRRRVEGASEDYRTGVSGKGSAWQSAATAASGSYKTAVSAGDIETRYKSGISSAGSAKYTDRATKLGPGRYAEAAPASEGDFSKGMAPVLSAIASVDLPPRGPRGSAQNYNRVKPIGDALTKLRVGR